MQSFTFQEATLDGPILIEPLFVPDTRGYTHKTFDRNIFASNGINLRPWEELRTRSRKGVIRGLHFQRRHGQDKLVHTIAGEVYDVVVDLRKGSDSFGRWEGFRLTEQNKRMLYIPKGFAHGFLALAENTVLSYLIGDRYDPDSDGGVKWDDPDLGIDWPLDQVEQTILSDRDGKLPSFDEFRNRYGALDPSSGGVTWGVY